MIYVSLEPTGYLIRFGEGEWDGSSPHQYFASAHATIGDDGTATIRGLALPPDHPYTVEMARALTEGLARVGAVRGSWTRIVDGKERRLIRRVPNPGPRIIL